jgi:3-hydroxybutyryl-CoA dehydrogenase
VTLSPIAVVGPGRINRGIAQAFLWAGHPVSVVDLKPRDGAEAARVEAVVRDEIAQGFKVLTRLGRTDGTGANAALARLTYHGAMDAEPPLAAAKLIIEGVPENLAAKEDVLRTIARLAPDAIIASATSTIMADELAAFVDRPGRFLNAHFLNPAWLIPLVEVSPGAMTSEATIERTEALLRGAGKVPVRCAASPGFIVPRVQMLAGSEAIRLLQEGVASADDIDQALRIGFALRFAVLGFLEFSDWGGLDIAQAAGDYLADHLDGEHYRAPPIIAEKLARGERGMYAGRGFFDYENRDLAAYRQGVIERLLDLVDHLGLFPKANCAQGSSS